MMAETLGKEFPCRLCFPSLENGHNHHCPDEPPLEVVGELRERGEGEIGTRSGKEQPSLSLL